MFGSAGDGVLGCLLRSTHGGVDVKLRRVLGEDSRDGDEGGKSDVLDHCVLWGEKEGWRENKMPRRTKGDL